MWGWFGVFGRWRSGDDKSDWEETGRMKKWEEDEEMGNSNSDIN